MLSVNEKLKLTNVCRQTVTITNDITLIIIAMDIIILILHIALVSSPHMAAVWKKASKITINNIIITLIILQVIIIIILVLFQVIIITTITTSPNMAAVCKKASKSAGKKNPLTEDQLSQVLH